MRRLSPFYLPFVINAVVVISYRLEHLEVK